MVRDRIPLPGGSAALTTTPGGGLASTDHYTPFGFDVTGAGAQYRGFSGQHQWTDTSHTGGQYDFMYREYNSEQGRWWTPDPAGLAAVDPGNPQSWNRYAYVAGTPLSATDPLGLDSGCESWITGDGTQHVACPPWDSPGGVPGGSRGPGGCTVMNHNPNRSKGHIVLANYRPGERPRVEYVSAPDCGGGGYSGGGGGPIITRLPGNGDSASLGDWHFKGIACSLGLAEANKTYAAVGRAEAAWPTLRAAGAAHGVSPALLAAVGIRESAFEDVNQPDGAGVGVFQLTPGQPLPNGGVITAAEASNFAWAAGESARELAAHRRYAESHFPWFTAQEIIQATADLYNMGPGPADAPNITGNPATIDVGTPGGDYGIDVWEMMSCFP